MPRNKEFDQDAVLDRAMRLFWEKGYEASSLEDLVNCMGISRASLYGTFKDKHTLFLKALERYDQEVTARGIALLEEPGSAREALRRFFMANIVCGTEPAHPPGCLLSNCAVERGLHDDDIAERVTAGHRRIESALARVIQRGQKQGEIKTSLDPRTAAKFLNNSLQGLQVLIKAGRGKSVLHAVVKMTLEALY